jgi:signal transduction histidine kinase/DNA-binding response OmpR family regulator
MTLQFNKITSTKKRLPLWLQLLLSLSLVFILVDTLTSQFTERVVRDLNFKQLAVSSQTALALLAASSTDAVISQDIPLLETIASQSLDQTPDIVSMTIANNRGESLVKQQRTGTVPEHAIRSYRHAVTFKGEQFGTISIDLHIEQALKEIDNRVAEVQLFIAIVLAFFSGMILILSHWLTIRPIRNITRYLTRLSEAKPLPQLENSVSLSRELALLSDSAIELSSMIDQRDQHDLELVRTREQLVFSHDEALVTSRAKSNFLATMSHEIRTPMNAVLGILGLLKDSPLNDHQKHLVGTGREAGELLMTIINDILDFSRMEADKLQLEHSSFDLYRMFEQSIALLKYQANRKDLALILELDENLPQYVKGDPDRIRQILINLINNAIKFTSNGKVTVSVSVAHIAGQNMHLKCAIRDTGIGVEAEAHASLFDEFTMADQSHSRRYEGTGLGLAICKRLVNLMQGEISFKSQPGKGSVFNFTIKLELAAEKDCETGITIINPNQQKPDPKIRILLAEDNPANQLVTRNILEISGLQVDIVGNGREAVDAVQNLPYDIVLMDVSMPEMDGIEATREIRQSSGTAADIPIVALTAHSLAGDRERFLEAGMNDYLSKPIDRNALLNSISYWSKATTEQPPLAVAPKIANEETSKIDYVDESVLQQLVTDTDAEIMPELLTLYIADSEVRVGLINKAIVDEDFKVLEFESHTLGSSAAAHGNIQLHQVARKIEDLCHGSDQPAILEQAAKISPIAKESFRLLALRAEKGFR